MTDLVGLPDKSLESVFKVLEAELSQVKRALDQLQSMVGTLVQNAVHTHELQRDFQSLDLATQSIQGLMVVMGNLASVVDPSWVIIPQRITTALTLQAMIDRICENPVTNINERSGNYEQL